MDTYEVAPHHVRTPTSHLPGDPEDPLIERSFPWRIARAAGGMAGVLLAIGAGLALVG